MNPSQRIIAAALKGLAKPMLGTDLFKKVNKKKLMPKGTYGANLGVLVNLGYITSKRCQKAGKNKLYVITSSGLEAMVK